MTQFSVTLAMNALTWVDNIRMVPKSTPYPGVKTTLNRSFHVSWEETEKIKGQVLYDVVDPWIDENLRQGIQVIACAANKFPDHINKNGNWQDDFRAWFTQTVLHCKGRVKFYEGLNEFDVNTSVGYHDSLLVAEHSLIMYQVIAEHDPAAKFIFPSIMSLGPTGEGLYWYSKALEMFILMNDGVAPEYCAVHMYEIPGTFAITQFAKRLREFKGMLIACGANLAKVMCTEYGRFVIGTNKKMFADFISKEKQAWLRLTGYEMIAAEVEHALYFEGTNSDRKHGGFGWDDPVNNLILDWNPFIYTMDLFQHRVSK